ncbi:MAG: DUF3828 domain-containing protein [Leptolyngbya sp. Prado105]|nr:DUF3828 domain-containing protein [Leptolyngbya sp. Prado105]
MSTFTKIGLLALLPFLCISTTQSAIAAPTAQATLTQARSTPRSTVDQFYKAYVSRDQLWRDLKQFIDPATYAQLSRVKIFDVEPFTDSQARVWSYTIGKPQIKGNEARVPLRLMVGLRRAEAPRNLTIVLRKNGDLWQIRNVIYSTKPLPSGEPFDLLHLWKPKT